MRPYLITMSPVINNDFDKKIIYLTLIWSKMFSEIGSLFQNSWPFYDRTSWMSVTPFFHAFYYILGVVFQKIAAASHPFFSHEIRRYEHQKDMSKKCRLNGKQSVDADQTAVWSGYQTAVGWEYQTAVWSESALIADLFIPKLWSFMVAHKNLNV